MAIRDHELVACEGEWDLSRAGELAHLADEALANCGGALILDFRASTFVDASTVGAICALAGKARRRGVAMAVICDAGLVRRVFALTHLADAVPVAETIEDAQRCFGEGSARHHRGTR